MFWKKYKILCYEKGLSPNAVAKELSISSGTVTRWKNGSEPQAANLEKIADYFNVTVDDLLAEEVPNMSTVDDLLSDEEKKPVHVDGTSLTLNDHERQLIEAYRNMTDMQPAVDRLLKLEN